MTDVSQPSIFLLEREGGDYSNSGQKATTQQVAQAAQEVFAEKYPFSSSCSFDPHFYPPVFFHVFLFFPPLLRCLSFFLSLVIRKTVAAAGKTSVFLAKEEGTFPPLP